MAIQAIAGLVSQIGPLVLLVALTGGAAERTVGKECGDRCKKDVGRMKLWHATTENGACGIKDCGFKPGDGGKVGAGIYLAETKEVALEKTKPKKEIDKMFQVKVNLGCMLDVTDREQWEWHKRDIKANKAELERLGCDSIRLPDLTDGVEYVVYEAARHIEGIQDKTKDGCLCATS